MNTTLILENIAKHISLTEEEQNYFISLLSEKTFKEKQFIIREGDISRFLTFINSGSCRVFNINENGFENILLFASKEYWIGDLCSMISQKPGKLYIQALKETEVLQISKMDLDNLYHKIPKFERFFRILIERSYLEMQQRVLEGMGLTAYERFIIFNKKYASILNELPQKQIALYLGVTPEFFSRMKKKHNS